MTTETEKFLTYLKEIYARTNSSSFNSIHFKDFPNYEEYVEELINEGILHEHIAGVSFTSEYRKTL